MNTYIASAEQFLKEKFEQSEYFKEHLSEMAYRLEHSYRVAHIGKEIAEKEGLNIQNLIIGCLLHDISYYMNFKDKEDYINHGRYSANIARPFLTELGMAQQEIDEICYGIAIHVDDKADFEGGRTPLACSIGEADNIDRFDAYRIYETLQWVKFDQMTLSDRKAHVEKVLSKLAKYKNEPFSTQYGKGLWVEKIEYQIGFYEKLRRQINMSSLSI